MENSFDNKNELTSSKDRDEKHLMYSKSDNKEIMSGFEADAIIELFHLL